MAQDDNLKSFLNGGLNTDDAPEFVEPNSWISAFNVRNTGTAIGEAGVLTNIDSNDLIAGTLSAGINQCIGAEGFESIRKAFGFIFNSGGYHQIVQYDIDTDVQTTLYTELTDSNNVPILNLNPQYYVQIKLVNNMYLAWTDGINPIGFTNIETLAAGGYGTVQPEDFSLLKPQGLVPITGVYSSDEGKAANFVKGNLFQFNYQYVGQDFTYSAWSTWSKRIIPAEESTPEAGSDVRANNCIIVSVSVGSIRTLTINIAARSANLDYGIIKSVDRAYVLLLPFTSIDIPNEVYEAYDPSTGLYSFVFYNDSISIPVPATQTDEPYDAVPHAATGIEIINGNIIGLGDLFEGYDRPVVDVTVQSVGYNPNLTVPTVPDVDEPFVITETFPGESGSGAGDHKRFMYVGYSGIPHTNDVLTIVLADIRNSNNTLTYTYTVPAGQDGDLGAVVSTFAGTIPNSSVQFNVDGSVYINFVGPPYFGLLSATITLYNSGPDLSKSIHALLDSSSYQLAIRYRNSYGQYFPLVTGNNFIAKTQSFAQLLGNTPQINLTLNTLSAPTDAVDYQVMITPNSTANTVLDVLGNVIDYKGEWNAHGNSPPLVANTGTVGDAYQITGPSLPTDERNLGNGNVSFNTGDYVVYNGKSWDVVPKAFADMTSAGNTMVFKINPLDLFNQRYADAGSATVLTYDYSPGDRFTLHYYIDGSDKIYVNDPCVDLQVLGYDSGSFLVKVEKSATFDVADIEGKNSYFRLYSPKKASLGASSIQNGTVWYEIGQRYTITNGVHDTLSLTVTDGDVYFKTRSYNGAVDPTEVYAGLATDFNFSDFYASAYTSYGRPGAYNDVLEATERKACIRYSQEYILGSKNNGLTKFYAAAIYGDGDGQTSSSFGAIQVLWQRGNILLVFQELNIAYVPVFTSIIEDQAQQEQIAISQKLLNFARYERGDIAIGFAKESFTYYNNTAYFVDPNRCEPCHATTGGVFPISGKMSKFFKLVLQSAFDNRQKVTSYYDRFNNEWVVTVQDGNKVVVSFAFNALNWQVNEDYTIVPADVTDTTDGSHCTVSYDDETGIATYTPTTDYVGSDTATFTFLVDGNPITKNVCLSWTAGSSDINPFFFTAIIDQTQSTDVYSNTILITGNTIPAPISISAGGEYSINGGAFTSVSGTVNSGDIVQVKQTTSASYDTETIVTLTAGGQSAPFSATTIEEPPADETILNPLVDSVDYTFGKLNYTFVITDALANDLVIAYDISYLQDGLNYDLLDITDATITTGMMTTGPLEVDFDIFAGTISQVTFTFNSVTPNPNGTQTIIYVTPKTIPV